MINHLIDQAPLKFMWLSFNKSKNKMNLEYYMYCICGIGLLMKMYLIKNKWFRTCVKYSHWMMEFRDEAINVILNQTLISKIQVGNLNSTNQTIHTSEPLSLHLCKYNYSFNIHVVRHVFNLSASNYRQKKSLIVIVRIS